MQLFQEVEESLNSFGKWAPLHSDSPKTPQSSKGKHSSSLHKPKRAVPRSEAIQRRKKLFDEDKTEKSLEENSRDSLQNSDSSSENDANFNSDSD